MKCITNKYSTNGPEPGSRSWNISRCSTTGNVGTHPWGTAPRPKPGPTTSTTWQTKQHNNQQKHYILFSFLDTAQYTPIISSWDGRAPLRKKLTPSSRSH